jgi:hypothetical protein
MNGLALRSLARVNISNTGIRAISSTVIKLGGGPNLPPFARNPPFKGKVSIICININEFKQIYDTLALNVYK